MKKYFSNYKDVLLDRLRPLGASYYNSDNNCNQKPHVRCRGSNGSHIWSHIRRHVGVCHFHTDIWQLCVQHRESEHDCIILHLILCSLLLYR